MALNTATFKIWRTHPEKDGTFQTFQTEVSDGMVVLDVVHKIQAEQAPDLPVLELQGGQVRVVFARDQRPAAADVYDTTQPGQPARTGNRRADARVPAHQGSRH